jgi:NTE family protein
MTNEPVQPLAADEAKAGPQPGIGLCLSGGGYRAMVFHVGVLWRLYEAGLLSTVSRISSVSGGSITAGVLALAWKKLGFDPSRIAADFVPHVVQPLRRLASRTIDTKAVLLGIALPGSVGDRVVAAYRKHLFGHATLQDLPDAPRFVINATNVQSGVLWRFMKTAMRDYRVGEVKSPVVSLAQAVAASSAFPPVLSPSRLRLDPGQFTPGSGTDLQQPAFRREVFLTDGGVYDNLGLETVWKRYDTVLVSDAGGRMSPEEEPKGDWARHAYRVLDLVDNQVRSLRKRQVIDSFKSGARKGAYWGIRTNIVDYQLGAALPCPFDRTLALAATPTRLAAMPAVLQERLINWGYAVCDAALRRHVVPALPIPSAFPYPQAGV